MSLLDPLYEAAIQPERWGDFLQKVAECLRVDTAGIVVHASDSTQTAVFADLGFSEEMRRDTEELVRFSPWVAEIQKHRPTGWYSGALDDALSMAEFRKTEFYNEFFRKYNIEWAGGAIVFGRDGAMPGLAVARSSKQDPFDTDDKELLQKLVPHLGRVFRICKAVSGLHEKNSAARHALDLIGTACITLDARGRVLSMNARAGEMISAGEFCG